MIPCTKCFAKAAFLDTEYSAIGKEQNYHCTACGHRFLLTAKEQRTIAKEVVGKTTPEGKRYTWTKKKCSYDGCDTIYQKDGLCRKHYKEVHGISVDAAIKQGLLKKFVPQEHEVLLSFEDVRLKKMLYALRKAAEANFRSIEAEIFWRLSVHRETETSVV